VQEEFVHLRARTSYSLSESAVKIEDLISLCRKHHTPAVAITDNGNLFAALEFSQAAAKSGIKPIIGCTINLKTENGDNQDRLDKIVLLVKNKEGFTNLLSLVSDSYLIRSESENYITLDELKNASNGLIVLTAGYEGLFGKLILENKLSNAEKFLLKLKAIFNDNLYIELWRRNIEEEIRKEHHLIDLAFKHNIPLVATNNIYFADRKMHEAHDTLLCIADGTFLTVEERRKSNSEEYFKTPRQMKEMFADIPEAYKNTVVIAKKCSHLVEEHAPMLPKVYSDEKEMLTQQARAGLAKRIEHVENKQPYFDRLAYEIDIITQMNFSGYFLIVSDFILWSKNNNIPVGPGRGSGAGSVVAWSLYITDLDPLEFKLIFERFLNPERISMPDFDIDFCQERREEVIAYVQEKYGKERVAQIITFGKLQAKAVVRDVGRVMQMPYGQVDKISKLIPFNAVNPVNLSQAIEMEPMLKNARDTDEQVAHLLSIALKLEGLHRHASTHAAGIVIADKNIKEIVPLYKDPKSEMNVIQYSMKYAEMAGLVKFDFLGLKTLTVIAKTVDLIKKNNSDFSIDNIPLDDLKTYKMLSLGDSSGIFQFESIGMRDALRKLRPDNINDLMALGALYRPGPMDNIPAYIACKHGKQQPDYLHPLLEEVLKETFGVIIYQEQVLQVAQNLAGYSLGSADLLRRAMGKKIKQEMDDQRKMFVEGAVKNKVKEAQAAKIFDLVAKFAGYGFNRAHAASYAIISYQTAYLKANYILEFLTSCLNIELGDTDKINLFCSDAKNHDIKILSPCINNSDVLFKIEGDSLRYGLAGLKNVGSSAIEQIILEREQNGEYTDVYNFFERIDTKVLNKRLVESLIKSGSFDSLAANRKQLFLSVENLLNYASRVREEKASDQINLFGQKLESAYRPPLESNDNWLEKEKIKNEFDSFGFYLSSHPIEAYKSAMALTKLKNSEFLKNDLPDGFTIVHLAGVPLQVKTRMSQRGRFVSILVSDAEGSFEISIYDDELLSQSNDLIHDNIPIAIIAEAKKDEGGIRITASKIIALDDYLNDIYKAIKISLSDGFNLANLKQLLAKFETGQTKIYFAIKTNCGNEVDVELPTGYKITYQDILALQNTEGILSVDLSS
jgi:DNA polymerase-3 subunit alpha